MPRARRKFAPAGARPEVTCSPDAVFGNVLLLLGVVAGVVGLAVFARDEIEVGGLFGIDGLRQRVGPWTTDWPRRQSGVLIGIVDAKLVGAAALGQLRPGLGRRAQRVLQRGVGLQVIDPGIDVGQFAFADQIAVVVDRGDALAVRVGARLALDDRGQRQRVKELVGHAGAVGVAVMALEQIKEALLRRRVLRRVRFALLLVVQI